MGAERSIVAVVGNPKAGGRTTAVARAVADGVAGTAGWTASTTVIELGGLGGKLLGWGDPDVTAAKGAVLAADLLVVASPVYKASITGLLKAFLDQFQADELGALATVPVMVGAGPGHALAVEHQLRPVLVEIGASCPTRGLYVLDSAVEQLDQQLAGWLAIWGDALVAVADRRRR